MLSRQREKLMRFRNEAWGKAWRLRGWLIPYSEKQQIQAFLGERQDKMVFISGTGRSGTQLMSDLIESTGRARVFHEPNFLEDVDTMDSLRRNPELSVRYWQNFRSAEVFRRWVEEPVMPLYCEVNGTIRYQIPAIKQLYPDSKLMLIARDGRGVVRSVIGWPQFYGPKSKGAYALSPLPGDPYLSEWSRMSRFEKVCWGWNEANEFLMRHILVEHQLQLERLTQDYEYFFNSFTRCLDIEISHEAWSKAVSKRSRNATKEYGFPEWQDWSEEQKKAFVRICGETMNKLGYII